jgi:hypothetical protein
MAPDGDSQAGVASTLLDLDSDLDGILDTKTSDGAG